MNEESLLNAPPPCAKLLEMLIYHLIEHSTKLDGGFQPSHFYKSLIPFRVIELVPGISGAFAVRCIYFVSIYSVSFVFHLSQAN